VVERMRNHLAREGIDDPQFEFVVEPKIDGLAISLLYRDGILERARPGETARSGRTSPTTCARLARSRCACRTCPRCSRCAASCICR